MLLAGSGLDTRLGVETMKNIDGLMDMYVNTTLGDILQPRLRNQFRATMELVLMQKFSAAHGGKETETPDSTTEKKPQSLFSSMLGKLNKIG